MNQAGEIGYGPLRLTRLPERFRVLWTLQRIDELLDFPVFPLYLGGGFLGKLLVELKLLLCFGGLSGAPVGLGEAVMSRFQSRIGRSRFLISGDGRRKVSAIRVKDAQLQLCGRQCWIKEDRFLQQ